MVAVSHRRARALRRRQTPTEHRLWQMLRGHRLGGWKWRRQAPFGPFVLDFYCPAARLVVEADGGGHDQRVLQDMERTAWLESRGLRVMRVWNREVVEDIDAVGRSILAACGGPREGMAPGNPSPWDREKKAPRAGGRSPQARAEDEGAPGPRPNPLASRADLRA